MLLQALRAVLLLSLGKSAASAMVGLSLSMPHTDSTGAGAASIHGQAKTRLLPVPSTAVRSLYRTSYTMSWKPPQWLSRV